MILHPISQTPPPGALEAIVSPFTRRTRRVEFFLSDGFTSWRSKYEDFLDGSINVDQTRDERRSFEVTISNDGTLVHATDQLWYDKIVKFFFGAVWIDSTGEQHFWETQVGEFMIDEITSQHFPDTFHIQGRDYTKKLLNSKFRVATLFAKGKPVEDVIKAIAINGGIQPNRLIIPQTGKVTGKDWYFDRGTERWKAIKDIAENYGYEVFFNSFGYFVMRLFQDPVSSPATFIFRTGPSNGNLVSFQKSSRDSRLYNSISVSGESANTPPVYGLAENRLISSPTSIQKIGERVFEYTSAYITTTEQAQEVANNLLWEHALEEYDLRLESICIFWLEAGDIVEFLDPTPVAGEPTRFLFSNFDLPFTIGSMASTAKRVTRVIQ